MARLRRVASSACLAGADGAGGGGSARPAPGTDSAPVATVIAAVASAAGGARRRRRPALPVFRFALLVAGAFAVGVTAWMAPTVGASRTLKQQSLECGSPPCLPTTATTSTTTSLQLDIPYSSGGCPSCGLGGSGGVLGAGTGSGPTAVLPAAAFPTTGSGPGAVLPTPAFAPAAAAAQAQAVAPVAFQPVAVAPVAVAPTPTVVGSGGINVISSNPISISNPITIKNPNINHDLNKVGAAGGPGGHGGGLAGGKAALLQGAANLIGGMGALGGAILGGRR
ncbi:hypothetical protein GPECTOR_9g734 [Gonium pectorale]|uniref:Uncharacterized protein n=1 Tax=Gonium pectorale TaxID=33097 RepID=A0A150GSM0_GONPE|nr:hypothetical protein GPECTOR_9g734 [Gonium pectorale]|eukprot:KXZ52688.1 hypothetical protein GPECTOR_9g734 [Gonium pectorale]